ncbi:hypothetical protein [Lysinibacillus sp. NPDC093688]|uniref:hypothetical protein n=1 Tax=Lysinibacillus sp. NPDC093688 TaxID=3390577 RepID=UPI003D0505CC
MGKCRCNVCNCFYLSSFSNILRQQQMVFCAKAKRQQQMVFCAKAKRQQQMVFCAKATITPRRN